MFERLEQGWRRFRVTPCPYRAAQEIERQNLGALANFLRDVLVPEIGDIGGKRCGFIGHGVASYAFEASLRAKRSNPEFK